MYNVQRNNLIKQYLKSKYKKQLSDILITNYLIIFM